MGIENSTPEYREWWRTHQKEIEKCGIFFDFGILVWNSALKAVQPTTNASTTICNDCVVQDCQYRGQAVKCTGKVTV